MQNIQKADTKIMIDPFPIEDLLKPFMSDYYTYYGSIATSTPTPILWIITRKVIPVSPEQVKKKKNIYSFIDKIVYSS